MTSKVINWGIIGAGKIAHKFAEDLQSLDDCKLVGIASRSKTKSIRFAKTYNIPSAYSNYGSLVEDHQVDAVYIATPHAFHCQHSMLALNNKKAVLCEKPIAMNSNELRKMILCAKRNNVLLMDAMWTAFLPHFSYVQELLKSKYFGQVISLKADFGFYAPFDKGSRLFDKSLGGGSLLDIGIYPVFLALATLGTPISIEANAKFFDNGADAECQIQFNYKNKIAALHSSLVKDTNTEAIFKCEKGRIKINSRFHEPTSITTIDSQQNHSTIDFKTDNLGYCFQIDHFNNLIRSNKTESPIMSYEISLQLIHHLDRIRTIIGLHY